MAQHANTEPGQLLRPADFIKKYVLFISLCLFLYCFLFCFVFSKLYHSILTEVSRFHCINHLPE